MSEEKNRWERLHALSDEYEDNPELAQRAIAIAKSQAQQTKRSWFALHGKKLTAVAASLVLVLFTVGLLFLPKLFSSPKDTPPQIVYYADETVRFDNVADVPAFVQEKGLPIKYFVLPNTGSKAAVVTATETFAYLYQQTLYIDMATSSYDALLLRAVVLQNATFDFEKDYGQLIETVVYREINIAYRIGDAENNNPKIFATFTKSGVKYYLEIQTAGNAVEKIEQYVDMLFA